MGDPATFAPLLALSGPGARAPNGLSLLADALALGRLDIAAQLLGAAAAGHFAGAVDFLASFPGVDLNAPVPRNIGVFPDWTRPRPCCGCTEEGPAPLRSARPQPPSPDPLPAARFQSEERQRPNILVCTADGGVVATREGRQGREARSQCHRSPRKFRPRIRRARRMGLGEGEAAPIALGPISRSARSRVRSRHTQWQRKYRLGIDKGPRQAQRGRQ
jgi:hypothetical protein